MIKQPLFGQDSSPHITSMLISAIATLVCWIIFCVLCFVVKFKPAVSEYKEIQIVLSSTPVEEQTATTEQAAATEQTAVPEPVEGPAVEETMVEKQSVEVPVVKETPKPKNVETEQPAPQTKTTPLPKQEYTKVTEPETYGTFLGDDIDFGTKNKSNQNVNWDDMFDNNTVSTQDNSDPKIVTTNSGYEGNQGTTTTSPNNPIRSTDNKNQNDNNTSTLSDKDLNKIRNAVVAKGSGTNGIETSLSASTSNSYSKTITMSDGSTRKIIKSSPINLSEKASKTIDFNEMTVKISFRVLTNGNVLPSSIKIDKAIFLDELVIQEINDQIKLWILAPADSEAIAIFELTIKKQ